MMWRKYAYGHWEWNIIQFRDPKIIWLTEIIFWLFCQQTSRMIWQNHVVRLFQFALKSNQPGRTISSIFIPYGEMQVLEQRTCVNNRHMSDWLSFSVRSGTTNNDTIALDVRLPKTGWFIKLINQLTGSIKWKDPLTIVIWRKKVRRYMHITKTTNLLTLYWLAESSLKSSLQTNSYITMPHRISRDRE